MIGVEIDDSNMWVYLEERIAVIRVTASTSPFSGIAYWTLSPEIKFPVGEKAKKNVYVPSALLSVPE